MNRRDFVGLSAMAIGATAIGAVAIDSLALPGLRGAAASGAKICHIIRLKFDPALSTEKRAQLVASMNRFKQIRAPLKMVVGKDLYVNGGDSFDYAQMAFFGSEKAFQDYFYAPIHLAADREAASGGFAGVDSFDTVHVPDADLREKLDKILADRDAKYKAKDTRPTRPPVADRAQDQKWNLGSTIYRVARGDYSAMTDEQRTQRFAAIDRLKEIRGVTEVFWGPTTRRNPSDYHFSHTVVIGLENEDAYRRYIPDPLHEAERQAGGRIPQTSIAVFDLIDPLDEALAERLKKFHAEVGA